MKKSMTWLVNISSKNDSFVINNDGTGHFANGRFRWTKDKIILHPENSTMADLVYEPHEVSILGKVIGLIRNDII